MSTEARPIGARLRDGTDIGGYPVSELEQLLRSGGLLSADSRTVRTEIARRNGQPKSPSNVTPLNGTVEKAPNKREALILAALASIVSFAKLEMEDLPPPREIVKGLLYEGAMILGGRSKIGKSFLSLDICLAIATGGKVCGALDVAEPGRCLYLSLEDGRTRVRDRAKSHMGDDPLPELVDYNDKWLRADMGGVDAIERWLEAHTDAKLVVIDTLKRFRPPAKPGAQLYGEDYDAIAPLADLAKRYHVCILIVHHLRKMDAEDPMDLLTGSTGIGAAPDGALILQRKRLERDGTLDIITKDGTDGKLALKFTEGFWSIVGDAQAEVKSAERKATIELLRQAGEPMTPIEIAEALSEPRGAIRQRLMRMRDADEIVRLPDGKYTVSHERSNTRNRPNTRNSSDSVTGESVSVTPSIGVTPVTSVTPVTPLMTGLFVPSSQVMNCLDCGAPLPEGMIFRCPVCQEKRETEERKAM